MGIQDASFYLESCLDKMVHPGYIILSKLCDIIYKGPGPRSRAAAGGGAAPLKNWVTLMNMGPRLPPCRGPGPGPRGPGPLGYRGGWGYWGIGVGVGV